MWPLAPGDCLAAVHLWQIGASLVNKGRSPDGHPHGRPASFWSSVPAGVAGHHVVWSPAAQMGWGEARPEATRSPSPCLCAARAAGVSSLRPRTWTPLRRLWWCCSPGWLPPCVVHVDFERAGKLQEMAFCTSQIEVWHVCCGLPCLSFPVVWRECPELGLQCQPAGCESLVDEDECGGGFMALQPMWPP